ncbi:copper resistance CopC family protein [Ornithinimicrobium sp. W1679]|uniref:copper resistance CopC family protein n=1 Tax=unclassified Ornithinimicrobium TaxID=2615080 RepID=UPI003CEF1B12
MTRFLRPLILLLATLLLLVPGAAQAHDQLTGTDPVDGAVLTEAPEALTFTFSGEVAPVGAQVAVTTGPGQDHLVGEPVVDGRAVVQEVTGMVDGTYEVAWRITSSDGHPISGTLGFTVTTGDGADAAGGAGGAAAQDYSPDGTDGSTPAGGTTDDGTAAADAGEDEEDVDPPVAQGVDTGLPGWVWLVVGLAVLGLAALLVHTWTRNRRG